MRFVIKYGMEKYRIYDESKHLAGIVERRLSTNNQLTVNCMDHKTAYTVSRGDGEIIISGEEVKTLHCRLQYPADNQYTQTAYWRPPMAVQTDIVIRGNRVTVRQSRNRRFQIFLNGKKAGEMDHMMSVSKELFLENDILKQYSGLIFAVGILMHHDDDIEILLRIYREERGLSKRAEPVFWFCPE